MKKDNVIPLFIEDTLNDIYHYYTKKDVTSIAKRHHIPSYYQYNKADLITYVIDYILQPENMSKCFLCMDDFEIRVFETTLKGYELLEFDEIIATEYLLINGYIGLMSETEVFIPNEVRNAYEIINTKQFHKNRKRIHLIGDYCLAANSLYGITPIEFFITLFNKYERDKLTKDEFYEFYNITSCYRSDITIIEDMIVDNKLVEDMLYIALLHNQREKPYYIPKKQEIESLGAHGKDKYSKELIKVYMYIINNFNLPEIDVGTICYYLKTNMSAGCNIQDIIDDLSENGIKFKTSKQEKVFSELLKELRNNTRMIINKGHTPNEIRVMEKRRESASNVIAFPTK